MPMLELPPLSLYIHLPWCIHKCPYCDFNSYQTSQNQLPEQAYVDALIRDLEQDLPKIWGRQLCSIFIGGGTPSLFSAQAIETILLAVHARIPFNPNIEITMEANPGTFEQEKFYDFRQAGVNRLSIGIQSFNDQQLKLLGRIHNSEEAKHSISIAQKAGFNNFNLDLMHGLPEQSPEAALSDLKTAVSFSPPHLSWYQLTLEPNTVFAKFPPRLPGEETLFEIQSQGHSYLAQQGYQQYEISAYSQPNFRCQHNLNYWKFGDYLGIGAGAHSKITDLQTETITRYAKTRTPKDYLNPEKTFIAKQRLLHDKELPLEFMMNALRLSDGVDQKLFTQCTGLSLQTIQKQLNTAYKQGLLEKTRLKTTQLGQNFLNDCLLLFDWN